MSTFYSITDIAQRMGLSAHTLRYYERIGLIDSINRQSNRHRIYNDDDVRWLEFLLRLRSTGMSIVQMQHYATLRRVGEQLDSISERRAMLEQHARQLSDELLALQVHLLVLNEKIAVYTSIEQRLKDQNK